MKKTENTHVGYGKMRAKIKRAPLKQQLSEVRGQLRYAREKAARLVAYERRTARLEAAIQDTLKDARMDGVKKVIAIAKLVSVRPDEILPYPIGGFKDGDIHLRPTPPMPQLVLKRSIEASDLMKRLPEIGMEDRSQPLVADSYARDRGRPIVPVSGGPCLPTVSAFLPDSGGPPVTIETVKKHADAGNRFEAVKSYRLLKGTGLGDAYKAVNAYIEKGEALT